MNPYLFFIIGVVVGTVISVIINGLKKSYGVLKIDTSDPAKDKYRIYIDDLDNLNKKKKLLLSIDHNADLSQE